MEFECAYECYCDCEGCSCYCCECCLNKQFCFNAYTGFCPSYEKE